jgi:hypothetical protein
LVGASLVGACVGEVTGGGLAACDVGGEVTVSGRQVTCGEGPVLAVWPSGERGGLIGPSPGGHLSPVMTWVPDGVVGADVGWGAAITPEWDGLTGGEAVTACCPPATDVPPSCRSSGLKCPV